jgi:hypothetical protein
MYSFGPGSEANLMQCRPPLQIVARKVIRIADHSIVCGRRNRQAQQDAFDAKLSRAKWGESPHNVEDDELSFALDFVPWPGQYGAGNDQFAYIAGLYIAFGEALGTPLRWGHDWDRDGVLGKYDPDETLLDLPHIEELNWKELR